MLQSRCYEERAMKDLIKRALQDRRESQARVFRALRAFGALQTRRERVEAFAEIQQDFELSEKRFRENSSPKAAKAPSKNAPKRAKVAASTMTGRDTYANRIEALVIEHPEGVSNAEVAAAVGQSPNNTPGTLRHLAKRGTIENRDGKWFPVPGANPKKPGITLRSAIIEVLADGKARGTAEIFRLVSQTVPTAKKNSVAAEIMRLKVDRKIVEHGVSGRGPLYMLAALTTPESSAVLDS